MVRKATLQDVKKIHGIVNYYASRGDMLPRSLGELYDNMRDYFVYEENGDIQGTGALHICWEDLAEVRSVCVVESMTRRGIGKMIVQACLKEAEQFRIGTLFCLTYQDEFFKRFGFQYTDKKDLPQKIWSDCIKCPKFPECDEIAMILRIRA
jgi:amino-acid N-acetyltransferase